MRRVFAISLAILIVMLATRGVMAQDSQQDGNDLLLKILKEKNILTDEQFQDIKGQLAQQQNETEQQLTALDRSLADYLAKKGDTVGGNNTYVQDQGVTFSSGDGMWSIYFGGLIQFGYHYMSGDTVDPHGGFSLFQNRFDFGGTIFDPNLKFYTQLQTIQESNLYTGGLDASYSDTIGGAVALIDAYLDYAFSDFASVRMGQFKLPFGRQSQVDVSDLAFGYRSMVANNFRVGAQGRDTGVMLHNTMPMDENDPNGMTFEWALGLWNGMGGNLTPPLDDTWLAWGGRVGFYPMGPIPYVEGDWEGAQDIKVGIAASVILDQWHNSGGDNPKWTNWEVDFVGQWMGIYLTAEYFSQKRDNGTTDVTDTGWYVQGGYFLMPGEFEIVGRYGMITYDNDDQKSEWALGVAYYFNGHEWKAMASLGQISYDPDSGSSTDDWFINLGVQADW